MAGGIGRRKVGTNLRYQRRRRSAGRMGAATTRTGTIRAPTIGRTGDDRRGVPCSRFAPAPRLPTCRPGLSCVARPVGVRVRRSMISAGARGRAGPARGRGTQREAATLIRPGPGRLARASRAVWSGECTARQTLETTPSSIRIVDCALSMHCPQTRCQWSSLERGRHRHRRPDTTDRE